MRAAAALKIGRLVVYPTESSYALGGNATDENAVRRIYQAKDRKAGKPIPVIIADMHMWKKYVYMNKKAEILAKKFMPGPVTIALKKRKLIPDALNRTSLAARIPGHHIARELVKAAGFPITSTSGT